MNWKVIYYCGICYIIFISVYSYNIWKAPERNNLKPWEKLIFFIAAPLIPVILLLDCLIEGIYKTKELIERKLKKKEEMKLKKTLGLRSDEEYLCFWKMGGVGLIRCKDCGYQEEITCCTHGFNSHGLTLFTIGRQCPNCHAFVTEYRECDNDGNIKEDFVCPKCGAIIRKKEESSLKGNDVPLICPKCGSARLKYKSLYFT